MPSVRRFIVVAGVFCALSLTACNNLSTPFSNTGRPIQSVWLDHQKTQFLILPTRDYFQPKTVQLRSMQRLRLAEVGRYLRTVLKAHPKAQVWVTGYPTSVRRNAGLTLSHQYAVVIASYFWNKGIPVRVIDRIKGRAERRLLPQTLAKASAVVVRLHLEQS